VPNTVQKENLKGFPWQGTAARNKTSLSQYTNTHHQAWMLNYLPFKRGLKFHDCWVTSRNAKTKRSSTKVGINMAGGPTIADAKSLPLTFQSKMLFRAVYT
jgi:hypothetical protein